MKRFLNRRFLANALGILLIVAIGYWLPLRDRKPASTSTAKVAETTQAEPAAVASLSQRITAADLADFPGLMLAILDGGNSAEQRGMISRLMRRWLLEDPGDLLAFLDEAEVGGLEIWDRLAPGMMEALRALGDEVVDRKLLARIVGRVLLKAAEADPAGALVWARASLTNDALDDTLAGIAVEMAAHDPEAAIKLLDEVGAFANQLESAADVGLALGRSGYPLALTWAESFFSETERAFALSGVLQGMAENEPDRAAEKYREVVESMKSRYREQVLADRAAGGGTVDEEYEGLSPEEIEKAELAKPNPNLVYLENATRAIARELARRDPQAALDWARSMDPYQGRAFAMETIYGEWSSVDPRAAYDSLMAEADRRPEVAGKLFGNWAMISPKAAATAALALASGVERDTAIEGVAQGWIGSGGTPAEIADWGEKLHAVTEQDRVRAVVASVAAYENPALAVQQVERIRNPLKRSELFQEVFPNLVEANPQLARSILATIPLSQVELEYFRDMLP